jgi:acetyl esterase
MNLKERVEARVLRGAMNLPERLQRVLAGRPVVIDGDTLATETQLMIRLQQVVREPRIEDLPLAEARVAYRRQTGYLGGDQPVGAVRDLRVDGAEGTLPARLYLPAALLPASASPVPLLVFFHGGGMMYGDLASYDPSCRFLAEQSGVAVLSVEYRLGPEHRHPAAVEDAAAAYRWVVAHVDELGADPTRLAVGGDSAGGYLSATTAITAAREGLPCAFQLLVYPCTDFTRRSRSRDLFAEGFVLSERFMQGAVAAYFSPGDDLADPRASVLMTEDLPDGLAPAYVATAGFDPLRDEGEAYAALLTEHGVPTRVRRFRGLVHSFFFVVGCGRASLAANREIAGALRRALA